MIAAFLWAQLEHGEEITGRRLAIWQRYHEAYAGLQAAGLLRRPCVPCGCEHNAHMYYLLLPDVEQRSALIEALKSEGIHSVFHYVPLHQAPAGRRFGRACGELEVTVDLAERLLRLPLWVGLESQQDRVIEAVQRRLGA